MTVRGTTHARHEKLVIIREQGEHEGERIWCAWDDCSEYGLINNEYHYNEAKAGFAPKWVRYVFCSEAHREMFMRSHIPGQYGRLGGLTRGRFA